MREKRLARISYLELFGALAPYAALPVAAIQSGRPMAPGALRTPGLASPVLGFAAGIRAIVRQVRRQEECLRRLLVENVAPGAALAAGLSLTYGFLETAGFPRLSMFSVWCVLCVSTALVGLARRRLGR